MTKWYSIYVFIGGEWCEYDETEYTEQEANRLLKCLKKSCYCNFKKKCIRNSETVEMSVRRKSLRTHRTDPNRLCREDWQV